MTRSEKLDSKTTALSEPAPVTLQRGMTDLEAVQAFADAVCDVTAASDAVRFALRLAAEEAFTNVVTHGYEETAREKPVMLSAYASDQEIALVMRDRGRAFDPASVPPADVHSGWEDRPVGGVGWYLIGQLIDRVVYEPGTESGNRLTLVKRRASPPSKMGAHS